ncbi:MAG: relaxase/mobilization nuclease domain-containing protein [Firmicutes bacterium]|nr:relaxase/mobilization nuclease domain-containing protein [Bacillota bacterium]
MQIGEELCDRFLQGNYQYVLAVHTDKSHCHCHIIFNNTNLYNGLSFTYERNQGKVSERAWAQLRAISDELCRENALSIIEPKCKGVSHFERDMQIQGKSWKDKLRAKIAEVAFYSRDFADFLQNCIASGIEYVYTSQNKVKLKFKLSGEGQQRFTRADTLGAEFEPENIKATIERALIKERIQNRFGKYFAPPKIEPTPPATAPPKLTAPDKIVLTEDEFFALLDEKSEKAAPTPKPTESKPPEKKEDVWASIRGMGKADEIIAALEAVGITSYTEFTGFMFNGLHEDDHTDEIADLKEQIKTVETIIAKMKKRDELKPTYKEYKGKSGWVQSRYKKKHSSEIEEYEEAVKYIKEHSTKYTTDGSIPSLEGVKDLLKRMKDRRDEILPEHKAFKKRQATASQYTREVRNYINEQHMKRERERSQQRVQAKHKKNYLE